MRGSSDRGRAGSSVLICSISWSRSGDVEGRPQRQQLVEGQAQGVDVGAGVPLAAEPLRGHVAERAQDVAGVRSGRRRSALARPKSVIQTTPAVSSSRFDGLMSRWTIAAGMGIGQPLRPPAGRSAATLRKNGAGGRGLDRRERRPARQHRRASTRRGEPRRARSRRRPRSHPDRSRRRLGGVAVATARSRRAGRVRSDSATCPSFRLAGRPPLRPGRCRSAGSAGPSDPAWPSPGRLPIGDRGAAAARR